MSSIEEEVEKKILDDRNRLKLYMVKKKVNSLDETYAAEGIQIFFNSLEDKYYYWDHNSRLEIEVGRVWYENQLATYFRCKRIKITPYLSGDVYNKAGLAIFNELIEENLRRNCNNST